MQEEEGKERNWRIRSRKEEEEEKKVVYFPLRFDSRSPRSLCYPVRYYRLPLFSTNPLVILAILPILFPFVWLCLCVSSLFILFFFTENLLMYLLSEYVCWFMRNFFYAQQQFIFLNSRFSLKEKMKSKFFVFNTQSIFIGRSNSEWMCAIFVVRMNHGNFIAKMALADLLCVWCDTNTLVFFYWAFLLLRTLQLASNMDAFVCVCVCFWGHPRCFFYLYCQRYIWMCLSFAGTDVWLLIHYRLLIWNDGAFDKWYISNGWIYAISLLNHFLWLLINSMLKESIAVWQSIWYGRWSSTCFLF